MQGEVGKSEGSQKGRNGMRALRDHGRHQEAVRAGVRAVVR